MAVTKRLPAVLALLATLFSTATLASPDIQHWTTSNGARVYFVAAPELPMVDIRVVFDGGAARDGVTPGIAALTSAMLEEGAGGLDADVIAERFDALGASFSAGSLRDMATVSLRSLTEPKLLKPALDTFALILRQPDFPPDALERVRAQMLTVLQAEEQDPGDIAEKAYYRALYGDHPYASSPNGSRESISALRREAVAAFHKRHYVGRNAVVAIVGAVDHAQAADLAEAAVGGLPAGEAAPELPSVAPLATASMAHITHPSSQTHLLLGQPGMRRGDPDYFPLYVGNHILGGSGLVSRISDEVREQRGLSYSAYSYFTPMRLEGPFTLGLQTRNDKAQEALTVLRATLERFVTEGPSAAELTAAKRNITGGFALNIDSNSDILGYIAMIGFYGLPLDYLDTFIDTVNSVTLEQIRDAFARRVVPQRMALVTVGEGQ